MVKDVLTTDKGITFFITDQECYKIEENGQFNSFKKIYEIINGTFQFIKKNTNNDIFVFSDKECFKAEAEGNWVFNIFISEKVTFFKYHRSDVYIGTKKILYFFENSLRDQKKEIFYIENKNSDIKIQNLRDI